MTRAPANLLAVRGLLLTHLNVDDSRSRAADLEPAEVGIVGDPDHRGGYHCGSDRTVTNDYSVVESSRDRLGLSDYACALDVGDFTHGPHTLRTFSKWLVKQCDARTGDTKDIREVIYSPDGDTVKRWDRLGKRSSGDSSHRWHTHISYFRDAIKAGRDQTAVVRRYLTTIGLIEGDDMTPDQAAQLARLDKTAATIDRKLADLHWVFVNGPTGSGAYVGKWMTEMAAKAGVDEAAIVRDVLAGLTPERIAAAIPEALTKQVADALAKRLQG